MKILYSDSDVQIYKTNEGKYLVVANDGSGRTLYHGYSKDKAAHAAGLDTDEF